MCRWWLAGQEIKCLQTKRGMSPGGFRTNSRSHKACISSQNREHSAAQGTASMLRAQLHARSHLQGMFFRTARMLESGMKPVYIFDGKPPEAKREELNRRFEKRGDATEELENMKEVRFSPCRGLLLKNHSLLRGAHPVLSAEHTLCVCMRD